MEIRYLKSPAVTAVPATLLRWKLNGKGSVCRRDFEVFKCGGRRLNAARIGAVGVISKVSGTTGSRFRVVSAVQDTVQKDDDLVFVAGATGRVGSRTVRELLKLGFRVKAGVRSSQKAEALLESVKQIMDSSSTVQPVERLEIVEFDLEKPETIVPALGNSAVVICCIGASEKEVFDVTGPYRIDYLATKNLVDAAALANAKHFIMVSSLGTNKIGFPAAILNLFWGVLIWKRKAEEALIASGIPYTIVRPGGMERPTDAYKETHNITLSEEDTLFGGQVSNLQVAELMAFMAKSRRLSYCKVVEVIAETTAPQRPLDELLVKIPYQRIPPKELDATVPTPELESKTGPPSELEKTPVEKSTTSVPISETQIDPVINKPVVASAQVSRPLSPFTAYEDLKPPTSPSPYPPPSTLAAVKVSIDSTTPSETATFVKEPEEVGQGNTGTDLTNASLSEAVLVPIPDLPGPSGVDGATGDSISSDNQTTTSRPLSPYAMYEDLKPPTTPTPIASGSRVVPINDSLLATALPDEPVSSLTAVQEASPPSDNNSPAGDDTEKQDPRRVSVHYHSPYYAYEDLKPPTSPTPLAPIAFSGPSSFPNGGLSSSAAIAAPSEEPAQPTTPEPPIAMENAKSTTPPKSSPLSPFTMYEDLKPPSSPGKAVNIVS